MKFWEERDENEKIATHLNQLVENLDDRRTLWRFLVLMIALNGALWAIVAAFPFFSGGLFSRLVNAGSSRLPAIALGVPFGFGLSIVYSALRLAFPDAERVDLESGIMSGFQYSEKSTKRWKIWLASAAGGVLNVLLLFLLDLFLTNGF